MLIPPVILFAAILTTKGFQLRQHSEDYDYYYEHYDQEYGDVKEEVLTLLPKHFY